MTRKLPRRFEAATALRRAAKRGPVLLSALEPTLRRSILIHWGSMSAARKALGLEKLAAPRQRWSRASVLEEIRRLHRSGQHMSTVELARAGHGDVVVAAATYIGGWKHARRLAGIAFTPRRATSTQAWDAAAVVAEIEARHRQDLTLAVTKAPKALTSAAIRIFGSWPAAVTAAGFDYDAIRLSRTFEDDELLAWLRQLAREKPTMSLFDLDQHGEHAVVCRRRWGSFEAAAAAAGVKHWPLRLQSPALSRREVLRVLRKRAAAKKPLTIAALRREAGGYAVINSVLHRFPRWDDALMAAGLIVHRRTS